MMVHYVMIACMHEPCDSGVVYQLKRTDPRQLLYNLSICITMKGQSIFNRLVEGSYEYKLNR